MFGIQIHLNIGLQQYTREKKYSTFMTGLHIRQVRSHSVFYMITLFIDLFCNDSCSHQDFKNLFL